MLYIACMMLYLFHSIGMIDQVVCTRGEIFVGTWFSTFTGYITRMRGYMGYSDKTVYFGDMAHRCVHAFL